MTTKVELEKKLKAAEKRIAELEAITGQSVKINRPQFTFCCALRYPDGSLDTDFNILGPIRSRVELEDRLRQHVELVVPRLARNAGRSEWL